jgi:hypothetical protein
MKIVISFLSLLSLLFLLSWPLSAGAAPPSVKGKSDVLCAQCRKPILGDSILVKGNIYFHPAHFTCSQCKAPLADREFFWKDDAPWCRSCYEGAVLPRCDLCGEPIRDVYSTDGWGNRFHSRHEQEYPKCSTCDRLVSERLTRGGGRYDDGRDMCALCRESAVETPERVKTLSAQAAAFLARQGVVIDTAAIPVRLVSLQEFRQAGGSENTSGRTATVLATRTGPDGSIAEKRNVEEIMILHGLPEREFLFVLLHELVHARLHLTARTAIDKGAEEGAASLASWLWARDQENPLARYLAGKMEARTDSYGQAFRKARKRLDYMAFRDLLDELAKSGNLP